MFSDLHSAIISYIFVAIILTVGGIRVFSKSLWIKLKTIMLIPTPLWVIILLVLLLLLYIKLKNNRPIQLSTPDPEYRQLFGVYWDKKIKMRCLNCGKLLKYSVPILTLLFYFVLILDVIQSTFLKINMVINLLNGKLLTSWMPCKILFQSPFNSPKQGLKTVEMIVVNL